MRGLARSREKYELFNSKPPRKLVAATLDLSRPLIFLGEVPEISYTSDKEGRVHNYRHATGRPRPKLFADPDGRFFLILGGRVRVGRWLTG